jgi:protein TonB
VLLVVLGARTRHEVLPPVYRVELIAAPAGERAAGVVTETEPPPVAPEAPPKRPETLPKAIAPPKKAPPAKKTVAKATPVPNARSARRDAPAPKAGGGPEGGKGTDVANVQTEGIDFPYPAYLQNVVRQIALRFRPRNPGALRSEVVFVIRRDGSVLAPQIRVRSGSMAFDLEALGAIEAAGRAGAFGPLPDGWADDALTVIFSFDPKLIR